MVDERSGRRDDEMDAAPESEARPVIHPKSPRQALMAERLPPPPHSRRARHPIVVIGNAVLTAIVLLILAGGAGFYFGKQRYEAPGPLDRERTVVIPRGGIRDTAELLRREGVIDQTFLFVGAATLLRVTNDIKAGEYLFERHASMRDVLDTLVQGQAIQHQVTIAEGLTSEQIVQKLMEAEVLTGTLREIPREGTLLPETYKVTRGTTREQVVARMANAQKRILQEVWERRAPDLPVKSAEELVVLASIVEKETGKADERTPRRRGLRQPPQSPHAARVRSDHRVRAGRRQGNARPRHPAKRKGPGDAVQYLCDLRFAARPDRQSRARLA